MRAELITHELDWRDAWARASDGDSTEHRLVPYTPAGSEEPVSVLVNPVGGLALLYMPPEEVWLLLGHMKLVLTTAEWESLKPRIDSLIGAGRINAQAMGQ